MAETTVENKICAACGAEARPNTLFCYNCGASLAPEIAPEAKNGKDVSDAWFRENIAEEKNGRQTKQENSTVIEKTADAPIPKLVAVEEPKLKSAAAMRRKSKVYQPKKVEVIWEEHDAPNGWFILAAVLLTLFAVGVLYLTAYLK